MLRGVREDKGRDVSQDNHWDANEEENVLPQLPAVIGVGPGHLSELGEGFKVGIFQIVVIILSLPGPCLFLASEQGGEPRE